MHYSINGWFGRIWWETPTKLLMESNGKTQRRHGPLQGRAVQPGDGSGATPDLSV